MSLHASALQDVLAYLTVQPFPIYLVGGSLRQWLLDKPTKDYDFVLPKNATRLAYRLADSLGASCFPLDKERDMARVVLGDIWFDFAPWATDLESDLRARDLTINAMACPVDKLGILAQAADLDQCSDWLVDPCQGLDDLRAGLIRGITRANFEADPLRLLRIYRFAAKLNFRIEAQTSQWAGELSGLLARVASERCLAELSQILLSPRSANWIQELDDQGLFKRLLPFQPDVQSLSAFEAMSRDRSPDRPADLEAYLSQPLNAERPRLFVFKLSTLLLSPQNVTGLSGLQSSLEKLTLSRREIESLLKWQRLLPALLTLNYSDPVARFHFLRQAGEDIFGLGLLAHIWQARGQGFVEPEIIECLLAEWRDPASQIAHPRQLLDGRVLQQQLGIKPGPQIGKLLLAIQEAQARDEVSSREDALAYARSCLQN